MNYSYEEINGLEKQLELLMRKLNKLKEDYILIKGTDASREFKLENDIPETEHEIERIKKLLSQKYNFHSQEGSTILEQKIRQINIEEELGIIHLVNCNRESMKDRFWNEFDKKDDEHFQFYFISACNTQMPHSFSERMIYEVIIEELEEEEEAIHVNRHEDSSRIKIFDLPIGRKSEHCQREFIKFFGKYFKFKETENFDNFLNAGIPKMDYEYVAIVFEVVETGWKDFYQEYFQWIIEKFTATHDAVPKFLFFFVTYLEGLHDKPDSKVHITNTFSEIAKNNPSATHLSPLMPVKLIDVKDWLRKIGERNPTKIQAVIDTLAKGLKPEKQKLLRDKNLINMADVERLQEIVFKIANEEKRK